jgi:hypothetical protein
MSVRSILAPLASRARVVTHFVAASSLFVGCAGSQTARSASMPEARCSAPAPVRPLAPMRVDDPTRELAPTSETRAGAAVCVATEVESSAPSTAGAAVRPTATRPAVVSSGDAPTLDSSSDEASSMLSRDEQIAQWSQRLAAAEQQFLQSAGVCRDVCRASAGICAAARELCALTGDRAGAPPTDPRCARARASCERTSRQREEACPSCPDPA